MVYDCFTHISRFSRSWQESIKNEQSIAFVVALALGFTRGFWALSALLEVLPLQGQRLINHQEQFFDSCKSLSHRQKLPGNCIQNLVVKLADICTSPRMQRSSTADSSLGPGESLAWSSLPHRHAAVSTNVGSTQCHKPFINQP